MAISDKNTGTYLSQPPYGKPVVDPSTGFMSMAWRIWHDALKRRLGNTYSNSISDLQDSGVDNANNLNDLKTSVSIIDDNLDKVDSRTTVNEKDIKDLKNQQDIDHENIVTNGQVINEVKNSVSSMDTEVKEIQQDITIINNNINSINQVLNKVSTVSSLPTGSQYKGTFVIYNSQLCFSFDGNNWVAVTTQAVT